MTQTFYNHSGRVSAVLLIFLFVYTASSKLMHPSSFVSALRKSPVLNSIASPTAVLLPFIELFVAALLIFPRWRRAGFGLSFCLLLLFTAYIGYMLVFAPHLPCSCGGVVQALSWTQHFYFNLFFLLLSYLGFCLHKPTPFHPKLFFAQKTGEAENL